MSNENSNIPYFVALMEQQIETYREELNELLEHNLYLDIKYDVDTLCEKIHSLQEQIKYLTDN